MDFNLIMWPLVKQINLLRIHRSAFTWAVLMFKDPYQTTKHLLKTNVHILSVHKKDRRYKDGWEMMGGVTGSMESINALHRFQKYIVDGVK